MPKLVVLAVLLALASACVVAGVALLSVAAAFIVGGVLFGALSLLFLLDVGPRR